MKDLIKPIDETIDDYLVRQDYHGAIVHLANKTSETIKAINDLNKQMIQVKDICDLIQRNIRK
jgi:hypothetical protein